MNVLKARLRTKFIRHSGTYSDEGGHLSDERPASRESLLHSEPEHGWVESRVMALLSRAYSSFNSDPLFVSFSFLIKILTSILFSIAFSVLHCSLCSSRSRAWYVSTSILFRCILVRGSSLYIRVIPFHQSTPPRVFDPTSNSLPIQWFYQFSNVSVLP